MDFKWVVVDEQCELDMVMTRSLTYCIIVSYDECVWQPKHPSIFYACVEAFI